MYKLVTIIVPGASFFWLGLGGPSYKMPYREKGTVQEEDK